MHPRCCRPVAGPATSWVRYTTSCNTQSSAPEDGQNNCPKYVGLTGIINKPLLLHLVGCLYYVYQWCTDKHISDNEIYLLIKYIKSVLWRVAKRLSYIEDARCLKVKWNIMLQFWSRCVSSVLFLHFIFVLAVLLYMQNLMLVPYIPLGKVACYFFDGLSKFSVILVVLSCRGYFR